MPDVHGTQHGASFIRCDELLVRIDWRQKPTDEQKQAAASIVGEGCDPACASPALVDSAADSFPADEPSPELRKIADQAFALALQADGKVVLAGESDQPLRGYDYALARYNVDGTLDRDFGDHGKVISDFGGTNQQVVGVAIQADGKIVAAGSSFAQSTGYDFSLARYQGALSSPPIDTIIHEVQSLAATGVLNNGQGNSLLVKLQHALEDLDSGKTKSAVTDLNAFLNEVRDLVRYGILTGTQGQMLIDEASAVIALLV